MAKSSARPEGRPIATPLRRIVVVGSAVLIVCCAICVSVHAAARASELSAAAIAFQSRADDLASKVFADNWAHLRDVRIAAERVGGHMETSGAYPTRTIYARLTEPLRSNHDRIFSGKSAPRSVSRASEWRSAAVPCKVHHAFMCSRGPLCASCSTEPPFHRRLIARAPIRLQASASS
jgi:hypothetical protein